MRRFVAPQDFVRPGSGRIATRLFGAAVVTGILAVCTFGNPSNTAGLSVAFALVCGAALLLLVSSGIRDDRLIRAAVRRAERIGETEGTNGAATLARLCDQADRLGGQLASVEQRLLHRHPVSGLPTREPLLQAMGEAEAGTLGIVHLIDLESLHAFDERSANALLSALTARITDMLGSRMIAQVDRARIAIWYAGTNAAGPARAQLEALAYALSGPVSIEEREILPKIQVTSAEVDGSDTPPAQTLARAIAGPVQAAGLGEADPFDPLGLARERFVLEQDLRRAIERGELQLHYQPLVDARAQRMCGAEALLRWQHPKHGMISPARFVPIMEAAGLADEIGLWALNTACREARALVQHGFAPFRVAVNVSQEQLRQQDLPSLVERILARHALSPDALEIELTETVAAADTDRASALFDRLRALGVAIAIDDFGTGYSSFSTLRRLRFNKIKIDREFVTAVDRRRDSQAICRSVLALGQGLGIRVLAEGVETADEYAWLRGQGCTYFQGFYFAKPLPPVELRRFAGNMAGLRALLNPPGGSPISIERLRA